MSAKKADRAHVEAALPNELAECHELIRQLMVLLESKDENINHLKNQLQNLMRGKFGRSSEKLTPGQLSLFKRELENLLSATGRDDVDEGESTNEGAGKSKKKNGGGGRKPLSDSLKRERRHYHPSEEELICGCCGERKKEIGVEVIDQLDYIPASFLVIEHATHKYACKGCQDGVVEGSRPSQIQNGGKAAEGLIAQISTSKHADHMPLYRQEQAYEREGVDVSRSSMGRWLDVSAVAMKCIYERMHELILQSRVVQADESPVLFIDKGRLIKKGKTGYVWVLYGDEEHPYTIYDFQPDRAYERAKTLLKGFENILLTDGYGGYEWYPRHLSANCNVHARRYFEKSQKYDKKKSSAMLALYSKLFEIEQRAKELSDEEKVALRQRESIPVLDQMKKLMSEWQLKEPPKTTLGIAINYALTRWDKLNKFTEYGCLRPDTNLVENAIRVVALGRKNWLHVGSEEALETSSVHASLVNTCKRLKVNPFLYLRDILIRLGSGEVFTDDMLPDRWVNKNPLQKDEAKAEIKTETVSALAP
jgi:transposase